VTESATRFFWGVVVGIVMTVFMLIILSAAAQAATVRGPIADLKTPPPPLGLHTGFSPVVLTQKYMQRWKVKPRNCVGCHIALDRKGRPFTSVAGGRYGPPAEIPLPATALLFGTALAGVATLARKKK
jgi:hypothetical protein